MVQLLSIIFFFLDFFNFCWFFKSSGFFVSPCTKLPGESVDDKAITNKVKKIKFLVSKP